MRFSEFRIIKEAAAANIVVVGDSIAIGIGQAIKGAVVNATVGINSSKILANASSDARLQGAELAIVSAGSNDIVKGKGDPQKLIANIAAIKDALSAKKYVWILPYDKVASEAVVKAVGGDKTVNLTSYPSSDGLHPSNYSAVATAARAGLNLTSNTPGAPATKDKEDTAVARAFRKDGSFYVPPLAGNKGPEVADLQKALIALGYELPKYGVDGMVGKETRAAIKTFQTDKGLSVDGIAGKDTIAAINSSITADPKVAAGLRQSTQADVKTKVKDYDNIKGDAKGAVGVTGAAGSAVKFFISKGWTPEQSAGLVGNLQAESGANLKIDAVGDNGQAYGIAQWHPPRQRNFNKVIGKDIRQSSLEDQLEFVNWELNNSEAAAGRQLKRARTAEEAAWVVDEYYERSSGAHRQNRINNALALADTTTTTA